MFDGIRTALPHPVRPGGVVEFECLIEAPTHPGALDLVLDIVAEGDRWFGLGVAIPVEVGPSVKARLSAQAIDGLVPLSTVSEMRRLLGRPNELERLLSERNSHVPLPPDVEETVHGLAIGGWAQDAGILATLIRTYRDTKPDLALEFGSGTSTVVLALLAERAGRDGLSVISVEQDAHEAEKVQAELERRGLSGFVRFVVAPLSETAVGGVRLLCYDPQILDAELAGLSPGLILVDGPSTASGGNRYPTLLLLQRHLRASAVFILDDAWRDVELTVAERWQACAGIEVDGIVPIGKGAVLGRIEPIRSELDLSQT